MIDSVIVKELSKEFLLIYASSGSYLGRLGILSFQVLTILDNLGFNSIVNILLSKLRLSSLM